MCNLYSMTSNAEAIARLFRVGHNRAAIVDPLPAIFPGHRAPVVRLTPDGARELVALSWGFVLPQVGKAARRVTNVRDDTARSSRFWADSFAARRCLVPATSFCEPKPGKPATWHWFALGGDGSGEAEGPRPLFAFPGLWRHWRGALKTDGPVVDLDVFAFMTTTPNRLVSTINHERMPVLLSQPAEFDCWLNGTSEDAFALARAYPPERMRIVQSGLEKKDLLAAD